MGDYTIESELGSGGFSVVYLARHNLTVDDPERTWWVAIKEYLPAEVAGRDRDGLTVRPTRSDLWEAFDEGLRRFKEEALHMVRFQRLGSVVDCLNLFEANGTAYLVMEYDDGLPLSEFLRLREEQGVPCSEEDLMAVMVPLLECLTDVHRAGVLHRDIKPGNIFVRREDDVTGRAAAPMLLDFGAAKQDYLGKHSRSGAPYTPGYAAFEQTSSMGEMGPWTDIYALGATMWRMVAGGNTAHVEARGANPVDVLARNYALVRGEPDPMPSAVALGSGRFAPHVLAAIDRCLALYPEERPRNCEELLGLLGGATDAVSAESDVGRGGADAGGDEDGEIPADSAIPDIHDASPVGQAPVVRRSRSRAMWGLVAGLVAVVALIAYVSDQRPEMVVIPAGTFRMGCLSDDVSCYHDERPDHEVRISRAFALSKHEVTFAQWDACVSAGGCGGYRPDGNVLGRGGHPVVNVSWEDAKSYVSWLSREMGEVYRLPSESEWEYAARAGTVTKYSWGNEIGYNRANCDGCGSGWDDEQTAPVGSFAPNAFGLHDMHGNVWEWVEDCWNENYRGAPSDGAAWTNDDCIMRVVRGGSWDSSPRVLRSAGRTGFLYFAGRNRLTTIRMKNKVGFRVAQTLSP